MRDKRWTKWPRVTMIDSLAIIECKRASQRNRLRLMNRKQSSRSQLTTSRLEPTCRPSSDLQLDINKLSPRLRGTWRLQAKLQRGTDLPGRNFTDTICPKIERQRRKILMDLNINIPIDKLKTEVMIKKENISIKNSKRKKIGLRKSILNKKRNNQRSNYKRKNYKNQKH